jgi:hypothetical protein
MFKKKSDAKVLAPRVTDRSTSCTRPALYQEWDETGYLLNM